MARSFTAIRVFQKIQDEGLLSKMRLKAFEVLFKHGPGTANELAQHLPVQVDGARNERGNIHARLKELRDLGVAQVISTRRCKITDHEVFEYDIVPGQLPGRGIVRRKTTLSKTSRKTLERLRDRCDDLFDRQAIQRVLELTKEKDG